MKKKILSGIGTEVLSFLLGIVRSILIIPLVLTMWGKENYSLLLVVLTFIELMKVFDAGYQNYVRNDFVIAFNRDKQYAKLIVSSNFKIIYLIGIIELLLFLFILKIGWLNSFLGISQEVFEQHSIGVAILVFVIMWALVGSISGLLHTIVFPISYTRAAFYGIIVRTFEIIVMVGASYFKLSVLVTCFILAFSVLLCGVFFAFDIKRVAPFFYPWWKGGSLKLGIQYFFKSLPLTFNGFVEQFTNNNIISIISKKISLNAIPIFTTNRTIANTLLQVSGLIANPLTPEIVRFHTTNQKNKIIQIIQLNWIVSNVIVAFPLILLTPYANTLYDFWVHKQLSFSYSLFYQLSFGVYLNIIGKFYVLYLRNINHLKAINILSITRLVIVIGMAIAFVPIWGLTGLGFAILTGEFLVALILPLIFFYNSLNYLWKDMQSKSLLLITISVIVMALYFYISIMYVSMPKTFIIIMVLIVFFQWKFLDNDVKKYITKFFNQQ